MFSIGFTSFSQPGPSQTLQNQWKTLFFRIIKSKTLKNIRFWYLFLTFRSFRTFPYGRAHPGWTRQGLAVRAGQLRRCENCEKCENVKNVQNHMVFTVLLIIMRKTNVFHWFYKLFAARPIKNLTKPMENFVFPHNNKQHLEKH